MCENLARLRKWSHTIAFPFALFTLSAFSFADLKSTVRRPELDPKSIAVVGNVRIEFLSPTLVRLEQRGPKGFEDRSTFTVVNRAWGGIIPSSTTKPGFINFKTGGYTVHVRADGQSLEGAEVTNQRGEIIFTYNGKPPAPEFFPAPGHPSNYILADYPRIIPSQWGATPAPTPTADSGWDLGNQAPDIYVFVHGGEKQPAGYTHLREEFLRLTGPTELPPLYAFGFTNSRWYPYDEASALDELDGYRNRGIPLDTFVLDTDWRVGGSHGYQVATNLFPDMRRFLNEAHDRHAHIMFNDHPEPVAATALDPKEMEYRWKGLTTLLGEGLDQWWYDRNWGTHIQTPAKGLPLEVWGMAVYHDVTQRFRPDRRPLIMTNAYGIDNGMVHEAPHAAEHRYPIWWTGDTDSKWAYLQRGVANGVDQGALAFAPYVHEDLGGHIGRPTPELYVRYLEFGCLSPMTRVHCTYKMDRLPWTFGPEAEKIVTDYIKWRYRLEPTLYAAAHRNFEDGTPLLRRGDLEWPKYKEAADSSQYLLGDDLLVAPVTHSKEPAPTPIPLTAFGKGLTAEYFSNENLAGTPVLTRTEPNVDYEWGTGSPDAKVPVDHFSARWTGTLGPIKTTGDYVIQTTTDDGVRLWIDGQQLIDKWIPQDSVTNSVTVHPEVGKTYSLRLEYLEIDGNALCHLGWKTPTMKSEEVASRELWVPPGTWQDLWTGTRVTGPTHVTVKAPLNQCPVWARVGGLVISGPDVQYSGEKPWNELTVDAFVPTTNGSQTRTLYEDDGISPAYKTGKFDKTTLTFSRHGNRMSLLVAPRKGKYTEAPATRTWTIRLHFAAGREPVGKVTWNGKPVSFSRVPSGPTEIPLSGAARQEAVYEVRLPAQMARKAATLTFAVK